MLEVLDLANLYSNKGSCGEKRLRNHYVIRKRMAIPGEARSIDISAAPLYACECLPIIE